VEVVVGGMDRSLDRREGVSTALWGLELTREQLDGSGSQDAFLTPLD
jgi:hypothetical protein